MNYETIISLAFVSIIIACLGCLAGHWIIKRQDREVIPYRTANDCKPGAFKTTPSCRPMQKFSKHTGV